jgi:predicted transcriptional regulator of viral defense system
MTMKRQLDFEAFLADAPVFSTRELAAARGAPMDARSAYEQLKHHLRTGRVKQVVRGVYAAVPPGVDAEGFQPDRYLVGAAARPEGIFAYHAALELLGASQSLWRECALHCERPRSAIELQAARLVFLAIPAPLRRRGIPDVGVRLVAHEARRLRVTGPERTLVEGFRQPHRVGGLRELLDQVFGFAVLDYDVLEEVLVAYGQRSLWAAVGWLVDRLRDQWIPPERFLDRCWGERPRNKQYLVRDRREGTTLTEWNLILPSEIESGIACSRPRFATCGNRALQEEDRSSRSSRSTSWLQAS